MSILLSKKDIDKMMAYEKPTQEQIDYMKKYHAAQLKMLVDVSSNMRLKHDK